MFSKQKKLVSIGLFTYNGARYIREALDSLLGQTYRDIELVISDNASTDETSKICAEYVARDKRVHYIRQLKNLGELGNRNAVFKETKGEYFIWASDDDIWDKTVIEKCVGVLGGDQEKVVAMFDFEMFDVAGSRRKFFASRMTPLERDVYGRLKSFLLFDWEDDKCDLFYGLWRRGVMARYMPIKGWGRHGDKVGWGFEMPIIMQMLADGPCGIIDEVLFHKRVKAGNISPHRKSERNFATRILLSFAGRVEKIFLPLFWRLLDFFAKEKKLTTEERLRLIFWTFYAMSRLFWRRRI